MFEILEIKEEFKLDLNEIQSIVELFVGEREARNNVGKSIYYR